MKTVFATIYHPYASRNVLSNGAIDKVLEDKDIRIVLFCPESKKDFFSKSYSNNNLIVESIPNESTVFRNKINTFFDRWTQPLLPTFTIDLRIKERFYKRKTPKTLIILILDKLCFILGRFRSVRNIARKIDFAMSDKSFLDGYIAKYNPESLFITDIFSPEETMFAFAFKKRDLKISAMVRSWDGTTNKRIFRFVPDRLIVANEYIEQEAIKYHDMPRSDIVITGMPQYDLYHQYIEKIGDPRFVEERRKIFFDKTGLDPVRPIVLFAPAGSFLTDIDWQILEIIKQAQSKGLIPDDIQFLIRNHPSLPSDLSKFSGGSNFISEQPGIHLSGKVRATEMDIENIYHLCDSIYFSKVVVEFSSTIGLDAAVMNKPVIMIGFDGWVKKPYIDSVKRYQDEINMRNFVSLGGGKVVMNGKELIKDINFFLANNKFGGEGRKLAVEKIVNTFDGKCHERIAREVAF